MEELFKFENFLPVYSVIFKRAVRLFHLWFDKSKWHFSYLQMNTSHLAWTDFKIKIE